MYKVGIIVPSLSGGGGAERTATLLANELSKEHDVYVYAMSSKEPRYYLSDNVKYIKLDNEPDSYNVNKLKKNMRRVKRIVDNIKSEGINIILGYTIQGGIISCIVSWLCGIKCVVCERQDPNQFGKSARIIRDVLYKRASGGVFQTYEARNYFKNIVHNGTVIPNFISDDELPTPIEYCQRDNVIISAGRLEKAKNHKMLIDAFSLIAPKAPNYKLVIFGEGSLKDELQKEIESAGLNDSVFLYGRTDEIFHEYNKAKIFVLSSNYEGYPNALLEALCMGCACISTDCPCGGPRDMISSEENGILVKVGDSNSLADQLIRLINNEEFAKHLSINGLNKRIENGKRAIYVRWSDYIDSIISSNP